MKTWVKKKQKIKYEEEEEEEENPKKELIRQHNEKITKQNSYWGENWRETVIFFPVNG